MLGSALDDVRTETRRVVILAHPRGTSATRTRLAVVASAVMLASLVLSILLPLIVDPAAMPGGKRYASAEERASAFAEISGSLLDRYAEEENPTGSDRSADGGARPRTSTWIEAVPLPPPLPIEPLPDLSAADPSAPVPTTTTDTRDPLERDEEKARPDPSAQGPTAETPKPAVLAASQTMTPVLRVFVHFSIRTSSGRRRAIEVARALEERGYVVADIREVAFAIAFPKVRYFFASDRPGAERLAWATSVVSQDEQRGGVRVQDYTHFRPLPTPGNVEVWLASEGPRREG